MARLPTDVAHNVDVIGGVFPLWVWRGGVFGITITGQRAAEVPPPFLKAVRLGVDVVQVSLQCV